MLKRHLKAVKGFSLVELLIALLLGSVLLAMVIGLYVMGVSSGAKSLKYSRLRTDLQSMIAIMETDIRRAGYGGTAYLVGPGNSQSIDLSSPPPAAADCIVYSYNHNAATSIANEHKMGIRFVAADNVIQFGTGVDPLASNCRTAGNWVALSDNQFIKITQLAFTGAVVSSAAATVRSVKIELTGELVSDNSYTHSITTQVQVRNIEFN